MRALATACFAGVASLTYPFSFSLLLGAVMPTSSDPPVTTPPSEEPVRKSIVAVTTWMAKLKKSSSTTSWRFAFPPLIPKGAIPWAEFRDELLIFDQDGKPISKINIKVWWEIVVQVDGTIWPSLNVSGGENRVYFGEPPTEITFVFSRETRLFYNMANAMVSIYKFDGNQAWLNWQIPSWTPKSEGIVQVERMLNFIGKQPGRSRAWPYVPGLEASPATVAQLDSPSTCGVSSQKLVAGLRAGNVSALPLAVWVPGGYHGVAIYSVDGKLFAMDVEKQLEEAPGQLSNVQEGTIPIGINGPNKVSLTVKEWQHNVTHLRGEQVKSEWSTMNPVSLRIGPGSITSSYLPQIRQGVTLEQINGPETRALVVEPPPLPKTPPAPASPDGS